MNAYRIEAIRRGESVSFTVPREKRRKLWDWCKAHSEDGRVTVREIDCMTYGTLRYRGMKRLGQAVPEVRAFTDWNFANGRNQIRFSEVRWSYVR